jgi:flagellar biosynthesis/type III secretory pathway chaperone
MTVQRRDLFQTLTRMLAEESGLLGELETILQQETEVLRGEDAAAIQRIGGNRHRCVDTLSRLDAERNAACQMLSFGSGRGALDRLFDWADPSTGLHTKWLSNLELARRCKTLNDTNGAIVAAKLNRVQQLLGKLRGSAAPPVYSSKGARYAGLGLRDLGHA